MIHSKNLTLSLMTLSLFLYGHIAFAQRNIAYLGGGGDPASRDTTIFDKSVENLDGYLKNNYWNSINISFDGGHSKSENLLNRSFSSATSKNHFTKNNFDQLIENYETQMNNGQIKSGDQLLLFIGTHGALKSSNEKTHSINADAPNQNKPGEFNLISLDKLKGLTTLAKEKGIKLGIVDFSCYSGNTLNLANSNTCVITSTGPKHFGYNSFANEFINNMKSGKNLEDVFLETRKNHATNSYPMISSPEGVQINNDYYPNLVPYLYHFDENPNLDKMVNYITEISSDSNKCLRKNQYDELLFQFELFNVLMKQSANKSFPELSKIKNLIASYKQKQDKYIELARSWGIADLNKKEEFKATLKKGRRPISYNGSYTWEELLKTDFDKLINNITEAKNIEEDAIWRIEFQASINMHLQAKAKQQEILKNYPHLKDFKAHLTQQLKEMNDSLAISRQIATEEKKLYNALYENIKNEANTNNPCRDFKI